MCECERGKTEKEIGWWSRLTKLYLCVLTLCIGLFVGTVCYYYVILLHGICDNIHAIKQYTDVIASTSVEWLVSSAHFCVCTVLLLST